MNLQRKREQEVQVLQEMIAIYCKGKKHPQQEHLSCQGCQRTIEYSRQRIQLCPRMEEKLFCSGCPHPCFEPEKRAEIKEVMRYAGPRMLFHRPGLLLRYIVHSRVLSRTNGKDN